MKQAVLATGRRKTAVAKVWIMPGTGKIIVNKRSLDDYFGLETLKAEVKRPLEKLDALDKFDVIVSVKGGGFTGQAGAIRHGIARALLKDRWRLQTPSQKSRLFNKRSAHEGKEEIRPQKSTSCSAIFQAIKLCCTLDFFKLIQHIGAYTIPS
jgi:ribosomal protein S9